MKFTKITIILNAKPKKADINQELQWFGASLGLFGLRDKDKSAFRIFITLLEALQKGEELTSDEIATRTDLTRGTVIHHLNNLMSSGIVVSDRNKYILRMDNLEGIVDYMKKDADAAWDRLREVAQNIDRKLGL